MKIYKYILLDWDGCLAKTLDVWLKAYQETFKEYDIHLEDKVITHEVFGDWNGPKKFGITDIDAYTKKLLTIVNKEYSAVKFYDDVPLVIKELKQRGKKLILVTSSQRTTLQSARIFGEIFSSVECILTAEDVQKHKPDPEVIEKALVFLEGTKEESIIVGDSKSDLGAAQNASIDSLLYYPKHNELFYDSKELLSYHPTHVVHEFKKILEVIK